jgi:hypothetical protein
MPPPTFQLHGQQFPEQGCPLAFGRFRQVILNPRKSLSY